MKYFLISILGGMIAVFWVADIHAVDMKYCGQPLRNDVGVIVSSAVAKAEFRRNVACPSTGLFTGACPGWSVDHTWPLASCGCDTSTNMAWLPNTIKSCAGTECKDRWERTVYQCKPGSK